MAAAPIDAVRICNKCCIAKPATAEFFYTHKKGKFGLRTECRECSALIRAAQKDYMAAKGKEWRENNRERRRQSERERLADPTAKAHRRTWLIEWRSKNRERILANDRKTRTFDKRRESRIRCAERNPERQREHFRRFYRKQMATNPKFVVDQRISSRLRKSLRVKTHGRKWEHLVGYSLEELMRHLERQFLKGMSWENREEWEIDHIVPLSSFGYETTEDPGFRAAWALTNLRPLWAADNRRKSKKVLSLL